MVNTSLTVCMIVKNEEANLSKTLPPLKGLVDEIIAVDTGSNDNTKQLLIEAGAKIVDFPWINDFAAARNAGLASAASDWVLWLDADELLDREELQTLRQMLDETEANVVYMPIHECDWGTKNSRAFYFRDKVFRNKLGVKFERPINEQVTFPAEISRSEKRFEGTRIYHWGKHLSEEAMKAKSTQRIAMFESITQDDCTDCAGFYLLGNKYLETLELDKAIEAYDKGILAAKNDIRFLFILEGCYLKKGWVLFSRAEYEKAYEQASAALKCFDKNAESYCMAGASLIQLGRMEEAKTVLEKVFDLPKKSHPVLGNQDLYWDIMRYGLMGNCYIALGDAGKALTAFERLLINDPLDTGTKELVALLAERVGQ